MTIQMTTQSSTARISLVAVGHATSLTLTVTFILCVSFDLLLPNHAMFQTWQQLLPGFKWISWGDFLLGLLESYGYGWYFALLWVPIYNVIVTRSNQDKKTTVSEQ